jgi:hypothetical protein
MGCAGSQQTDDLDWDPARLTLVVGKNPLGRGLRHQCIACWHVRHRTARDNALGYRRGLSKYEIPAVDTRSARLTQPRHDAQDVSRECRFHEHDLMSPGYEHAAQFLQPLQVETEKRRMVDRGLFQIIEIRRVVDVAECIDLMKPNPEKALERWNPDIRE